jgi:general nucleoside transport system permease protein
MREQLKPVANAVAMTVVALLVVSVIFAVSGYSTGGIFSGIVQGSLTGQGAIESTIRWWVPLALISCGIVVCFRAGYFNVGAQGQMYVGAIVTFVIATRLGGPSWLAIIVAIAGGAAAGAFWASISAVLRVELGTNETLSTLMLNYIAAQLLLYCVNGPLTQTAGGNQASQSGPVPASLAISGVSGVSATIIILTVVAVLTGWLLLNRSRVGATATLAGRNPDMVRWLGADSRKLTLISFAYAGCLAGLAGALDVLGPDGRLYNNFSPNLGLNAVTVALVGILTVSGSVLAAFFFGMLTAAIQILPVTTNLPPSAFDLVQAMITFTITAQFRRTRLRHRKRVVPQPEPAAPETQLVEV